MAQATCAQLISEALLLAGDSSLTSRAVVWLNQWLRSQYMAWPWPFLKRRASGLSLSAGTGTLLVGAGNGGVSNLIQRIYDPIYLYTPDKQTKGVVRFQELLGGDIAFDEDARPTTQTGIPTRVKGNPHTTAGAWQLVFDPIPDRAYLISFDYTLQPADEATSAGSGGSAQVLYPNDRTIVHAIASMALAYMKDEGAAEMRALAATMAVDDRTKYGKVLGMNDTWGLDGNTFE